MEEAAAGAQFYWPQIWCHQTELSLGITPIIQKQGWCWWWEASCCCLSSWLSPSCPWTSSRTSPSLCSSQAAASCVRARPDHPNLASCLPEALPPILQWHRWRHLYSLPIRWGCAWEGSLMTAWSLPRVNRALPAFEERRKAPLFPPALEICSVLLVTLTLLWCVTENVIGPLLLRHPRSLLLSGHGKNVFGK